MLFVSINALMHDGYDGLPLMCVRASIFKVFLDYGARTSDQFLLHYGFIPYPNPADAVTVPLAG